VALHTRSRSGFTLFEVMAAVLILGLMYTVLAQSAIEGVRSEGVSRRRMEASLLADERLSDIETAMQTGFPPAIGRTEEEMGDFVVRVDVVPFDATAFLGEDIQIAEAARGMLDASGDAPLRLVDLRVAWLEIDREFEVRRTTFAYDSQLIAELGGGPEGSEADAGGEAGRDDVDGLTVDDMFEMLQSGGGGRAPVPPGTPGSPNSPGSGAGQ
jgi:prepilin-type N-terminal cleavage/methylation domain-containing protein